MNDWGQQQQQTNGGCVAALPDNPKRQRERLGSERGQISPCFPFSFEQGSIMRFEGFQLSVSPVLHMLLPCKALRHIITVRRACHLARDEMKNRERACLKSVFAWEKVAPMCVDALRVSSHHTAVCVSISAAAPVRH